jgi:hypothetical protein
MLMGSLSINKFKTMQQEVNEREIIIVILIHKHLHRDIGSYTHSAGSVPPREQRIHQRFVDCPCTQLYI